MSDVLRTDIPVETIAITTDDGRVFYSLDSLVEQYEPIVKGREFASSITDDDWDKGFATGQRWLLDAIFSSRTSLFLDDTLDNS